MIATRLFILGLLDRNGPMHGHQIRRQARIDRIELWADVKVGALYGMLRRLDAEGVISVARTEREGNRPERTVYAITEPGRWELRALRDEVLRDVLLPKDVVDLALQLTGDLPESSLRAALEHRRASLEKERVLWTRTVTEADPYLSLMERFTIRHTMIRLDAEIAWHEELLTNLTHIVTGDRQRVERTDGNGDDKVRDEPEA